MKKVIPIAIILLVTLGLAWLFFSSGNDGTSNSTDNSTAANQVIDTTTVYSEQEVANHSSRNDCWTIINNKVYDLTTYIPRHQGGDEILRACGKNGTSLFETRTDENGRSIGGGGSHSAEAESILRTLQIGVIESAL